MLRIIGVGKSLFGTLLNLLLMSNTVIWLLISIAPMAPKQLDSGKGFQCDRKVLMGCHGNKPPVCHLFTPIRTCKSQDPIGILHYKYSRIGMYYTGDRIMKSPSGSRK